MGIKISVEAHNKLIRLVLAIQAKQLQNTQFINKLETIDKAYAKHEIALPSTGEGQADEIAIKVPIVNSEIDDNVAFLTSIFVNRYPLFPVIAEEGSAEMAMMMQAMLNKDARQQRWGRQLLKFIVASCRYNIGAIEVERLDYKDIKVEDKAGSAGQYNIVSNISPVSSLKAVDMYNALFDYRVDPADIALLGEYAGYNEIISRTTLKALGNSYSEAGTAYNLKEAYESSMSGTEQYWHEHPDISTIVPESLASKEDWFNWLGILNPNGYDLKLTNSSYFLTRLYVRIIPGEFGIGANSEGKSQHPTIVKLTIINNKWIINYQEVITPLNALPIFFSDTREDGFGYQTRSPGENVMPYQQIATELLHTRIGGAKRALNDRAIVDPNYIDMTKANSSNPSAKIPLKTRLQNAGERPHLSDLYHQIPFESQGTQGAINDLSIIMQIKDQVNGNNFARRGEQVKGNRTKGEFDQLNNAAEGKQLPMALRLEEQVFILLKLTLKTNILLSNVIDETIMNEEDGSTVKVNVAALRKAMLGFKITDGLLPKTAIRDPEVLSMAMQFIQNSQELSQTHDVGGIFADLMSVLDIDISKHKRQPQPGVPTNGSNAPGSAQATSPTQPGAAPAGNPPA